MSQIKIGEGETIEIQCAIKILQQRGFTEKGAKEYLLELGAKTLSNYIHVNETFKII